MRVTDDKNKSQLKAICINKSIMQHYATLYVYNFNNRKNHQGNTQEGKEMV